MWWVSENKKIRLHANAREVLLQSSITTISYIVPAPHLVTVNAMYNDMVKTMIV
jgi:hypothetical protein